MFFVIGSVRPRIVRSLRRSLQLCLMVIMGHSKVKAIATAARRCCHSIASLPLSLVQQQSLTPDKSSSSTQATAAQCTVPLSPPIHIHTLPCLFHVHNSVHLMYSCLSTAGIHYLYCFTCTCTCMANPFSFVLRPE